MTTFDEIRKTATPKQREPIIKAEKLLYKGYLFGHVSNGGGIVRLDNEYALRFIAIDEKKVIVQLLDYGKKLKMTPQTWQKTKTVKAKKPIKIESVKKKEEQLF